MPDNKKKHIQIILNPLIEEDKKVIDHLAYRYPHLRPAQAYREVMKRDMEERNR